MKIDNSPITPPGRGDVHPPQASARASDQQSVQNREEAAAFSVDISPLAGERAAATGDEDQARREKIAAIRAQLAAGSYSISGKDVAEKILNSLKN